MTPAMLMAAVVAAPAGEAAPEFLSGVLADVPAPLLLVTSMALLIAVVVAALKNALKLGAVVLAALILLYVFSDDPLRLAGEATAAALGALVEVWRFVRGG